MLEVIILGVELGIGKEFVDIYKNLDLFWWGICIFDVEI